MILEFYKKVKEFIGRHPRMVAVVGVTVAVLVILGSVGTQAAWYSSTGDGPTWQYRQKITIDADQVDAELTDFPVYVDLSDFGSDFFSNVAADGGDIRITTADGTTELAREVVSVDTASSTGELHFKADSLSASSDSEFFIYYGSSGASDYAVTDTYGRNAVWSDYRFVSHDAGYTDSSGALAQGTLFNGITPNDSAGIIGKATLFDKPSQQYVQLGDTIIPPSSDFTFDVWAEQFDFTGTTVSDESLILTQNDSGSTNATFVHGSNARQNHITGLWDINNSRTLEGPDIRGNGWVKLQIRRDGNEFNLFHNNVLQDATTTAITIPDAANAYLGAYENNGPERFFTGLISEVRSAYTARSDDWIATEYTNQNNTTDFYTIGAQDTQPDSNVAFGANSYGDFADTRWSHREKITIDAAQVDADLADFPVYVDLADLSTTFFQNTNVTCGDIRVTAGDGLTELAREVVACDTASSTGELHFKADSLSASSDTEFYIYYGNNSANNYIHDEQFGRDNVWSDGYAGVWHLSEGSGEARDSTANSSNGTNNGATQGVVGQVGGGYDFDGTDDYVKITENFVSSPSELTISAWFKKESGGDVYETVLHKGSADTVGSSDYWLGVSGDDNLTATIGANTGVGWDAGETTTSVNLGQWYHMAATWDGSVVEVYLDGQFNKQYSLSSYGDLNTDTRFGSSADGTNYQFRGTASEIRIYNKSISGDEISATYRNQNSPTTFYTVGVNEASAGLFGDNPSGDFADADWGYREKITIDADQVGATLTDFPVYVDLSNLSATFFDNVTASGGDIRVTAGDGTTQLAREVVSVNTASSTGELHFKADSISSTTDTSFYIYYGNPNADDYAVGDTYGAENVWSNETLAAFHLEENAVNSSDDNFNGTINGSPAWVTGVIYSALDFLGTNGNNVEISSALQSDITNNSYTVKAWINPRLTGSSNQAIIDTGSEGDGQMRFFMNDTDGSFKIQNTASFTGTGVRSSAGILTADIWNQVVAVVNGTSAILYHNGQEITSGTIDAYTGNGNNIAFGDKPLSSGSSMNALNGSLDEVYIYNSLLSTDWIAAEYTNQSTTTDFYTVGSLEEPSTVFGDDTDGDFADTDWTYREKITINADQVEETLTDFPVYVDLSDFGSQFFNNVRSDGGDIRITASDGTTELAREVVSVDTASSTGEIHFKADEIDAEADTDFYIYYGNTAAVDYVVTDTYGRNAVWSNGYAGVWHTGEDSATQTFDSTGNNNTGNFQDNLPTTQSGKIGDTQDFDGTSDYIDAGTDSSLDITTEITVGVWVNPDNTGGDYTGIVNKSRADTAGFWMGYSANGDIVRWETNDAGGSWHEVDMPLIDAEVGEWNHFVGVYDGSELIGYKNGSQSGTPDSFTGEFETTTNSLKFGDFEVADRWFDGMLDEIRISSAARSADWIATEYNNQNAPSSFYTISGSPSEAPVLLTPEDTATEVSRAPTLDWQPVQSATEYQVQVSPTSTFSSITVDANATDSEIALGTPYPSLDASTTYHWRVRTVDGQSFGAWSTDFSFTTAAGLAGSGTEADPYLISTPQDLDDIRNDLDAYYRLTQDIDLTFDTRDPNGDFYNAGDGWQEIDNFDGEFDMGGYSIIGARIFNGFFDNIGSNGLIHSGKFADCEVHGGYDQGVINETGGAGLIKEVVVDNCSVASGNTTSRRIGGFSGRGISSQDVISRNLVLGGEGDKGANTGRVFDTKVYTRNLIHNVSWEGVSGQTENPLFGWIQSGGNPTVNDVFFDDDTLDYAGTRTDQGTGLTTTEAQDITTYENAGWDIVPIAQHDGQRSTAIWYIDDGNDYPRLWFEYEGEGWKDGWSHREKVTIKSSAVDATLEDFPVYVDLADFGATFFNNVRTDGGDIRVTKADGTTELAREVVSVDTASSTGELHFKADRLASTTDTTFYVYYGNPDASEYATDYAYGRNVVWSDYENVYHLDEQGDGTTGEHIDSAGNHDLTAGYFSAGIPNRVDGNLGYAQQFNGTDTSIGGVFNLSAKDEMVVSVWAQPTASGQSSRSGIFGYSEYNVSSAYRLGGFRFTSSDLGGLDIYLDDGSAEWFNSTLTLNLNQWNYMVGRFESGVTKDILINDQWDERTAPTGSLAAGTSSIALGEVQEDPVNRRFQGLISEARYSTVKRSQEFYAAEYTNQSTTTDFYTVDTTPIQIDSIEDLDDVRNDLSASYELTRNLDFDDCASYDTCANMDTYTTGSGWDPIGTSGDPFTGQFDFKGHSITGLMINRSSTDYQGLFGALGLDGYIHSGSIINADVIGEKRTAVLVGFMDGNALVEHISIRNSTVGGSYSGNKGLLVGWLNSTTSLIRDSYAQGQAIVGNYSAAAGEIHPVDAQFPSENLYFVGTLDYGASSPVGGIDAADNALNSFYDQDVAGEIFGADPGNATTTVIMQDIDTYINAGWDIVPIEEHDGQESTATWFIDDGNDYPKLWFEREGAQSTAFGDDPDGDFADTDWSHREKITINPDKVPTVTSSVNSRVTQSSDDAEEKLSDNSMLISSSDLELIADGTSPGGDQEIGLRFQNITIPQGAVITNAYIEFQTDETNSTTTNLTFRAEDNNDTTTFTTGSGDITNRSKTAASVDWNNVPAWNTISEKHQTPDLSAVVQEVVDRAGWQSGNAMAMFVTGDGTRIAEAYDGEAANAPLLHIEYESPAATLTDFPVYVDLADLSDTFFVYVANDGADIRVTAGDGLTELPREVVSVDSVGKTGELHFKADAVYGSVGTEFYIYYGNPFAVNYSATDTYGAQNVWNSNYVLVSHDGGATDSTSNGNNGTANGDATAGIATGKVGTAAEFDGVSDSFQIADDASLDTPSAITITAWVNANSFKSDFSEIVSKKFDTGYDFLVDNDAGTNDLEFISFDADILQYSNDNVVATSTWSHVAVTYDKSNVNFYADGSYEGGGAETADIGTNNEDLYIGSDAGNSWEWNGLIDEVRILSSSQSADWITVEYNNQSSPSTFYSVGTQEISGEDTIPPYPDPSEFAVAPDGASTSSITMTAATSTDGEGSTPVEYYFNYQACAADAGTGWSHSGWLVETSYTDENLQVNQCYSYRVKTRDSLGNETAYSATSSAYTAAAIPDAPSLSNPTETTLDLVNNEGANPTANPDTTFAVQVSDTSPGDQTWTNQYVNASGEPSATAVWLTDSQLSGLTVTMLEPNITYTFRTKARNEDGDETGWSATTVASTSSDYPDETDTSTRLRGGSTIRGGSTAQ
ncbi:MAG: DUF2341 domain-containing protein [Candidatus Paceibacterota bacterium]